MVTKYTKDGYPYQTAPYTEEEIDEFDQLMMNVGPITVTYSGPAGNRFKAEPLPKPKQDDDDLLE
jgi:hypothetical protein